MEMDACEASNEKKKELIIVVHLSFQLLIFDHFLLYMITNLDSSICMIFDMTVIMIQNTDRLKGTNAITLLSKMSEFALGAQSSHLQAQWLQTF